MLQTVNTRWTLATVDGTAVWLQDVTIQTKFLWRILAPCRKQVGWIILILQLFESDAHLLFLSKSFIFQDYLMTSNFSWNSALKLIKSRILNKGPQIIHFVCLCQSFPAMTAGWRRSYLARNTTPLCLTKQAKVQGESHLSNSIKTIFPVDLWICFDIYLSLIILIP